MAKIVSLVLILKEQFVHHPHLKIIKECKLVEYWVSFLLVSMGFLLSKSFMMTLPKVNIFQFLFLLVDFSVLCTFFQACTWFFQIYAFQPLNNLDFSNLVFHYLKAWILSCLHLEVENQFTWDYCISSNFFKVENILDGNLMAHIFLYDVNWLKWNEQKAISVILVF